MKTKKNNQTNVMHNYLKITYIIDNTWFTLTANLSFFFKARDFYS